MLDYFTGASLNAMETSDALISGVMLKNKQNILSMICEALLGKPVKIRSNRILNGCKEFRGGAATDGRNIFLPEMTKSFGLLKLMALHQTMLLKRELYTDTDGALLSDPAEIHLDADNRLIKKLPSLIHQMNKYTNEYPIDDNSAGKERISKPWWGDLMPELIKETEETIASVKKSG